ncbi:hypothetical protein V2G26_008910 [Clonostachys chloroleuca]
MDRALTLNIKPTSGLESLPDDLLLDITEKFTTARDLASFGSTSRHLHSFTREAGWRTFCRSSFSPVFDITAGRISRQRWDEVANRLTYLDRCWERRAFSIYKYHEIKKSGRGRSRRGFSGVQSVSFHPVLDARVLANTSSKDEQELAVWGVGEDLITKLKPLYSADQESWFRLEGRESGYSGGFGDVTAVTALDRSQSPEVVVGRANGDLKVIAAAGEEFGAVSQSLTPYQGAVDPKTDTSSRRRSPARVAISWTDWQPQTNILASCRHSSITLHDLSNKEDEELDPMCHYDLSQDCPSDEMPFVRSAKFLGKDIIACGLGGTRQPLRWGRITPTGLEFFDAVQDSSDYSHLTDIARSGMPEKTTVRAIEPVGYGHSESLLLSAWEDGTYRLNDIRTSSPYDAMYRDRWSVYEPGSSLLVYGTQRFIAGSNMSESLVFFDFRNPKPYNHTSALPCSTDAPHPTPPGRSNEPAASVPVYDKCCPLLGQSCSWHSKATQDYWRPDAILHFGQSRYDRVHALAKASNLSGSFYCGVDGYVLEVNLKLAEDMEPSSSSSSKPSAPAGWQSYRPRDKISLMETGVGRMRGRDWEQLDLELPQLWHQRKPGHGKGAHNPKPVKGSRLDSIYYDPSNRSQ